MHNLLDNESVSMGKSDDMSRNWVYTEKIIYAGGGAEGVSCGGAENFVLAKQ